MSFTSARREGGGGGSGAAVRAAGGRGASATLRAREGGTCPGLWRAAALRGAAVPRTVQLAAATAGGWAAGGAAGCAASLRHGLVAAPTHCGIAAARWLWRRRQHTSVAWPELCQPRGSGGRGHAAWQRVALAALGQALEAGGRGRGGGGGPAQRGLACARRQPAMPPVAPTVGGPCRGGGDDATPR